MPRGGGRGKQKGGKKGKKATITICYQHQTLTVKKRHYQFAYPGATVGACPSPSVPPAVTPGSTAVVAEDVYLRVAPSPVAAIVKLLTQGTVVTVTGSAVTGGGFIWWPVTVLNGPSGYVQEAFLNPLSEVDPPQQPRLIITTLAARPGGPTWLPGACYAITE